jgi:hypothetical protein
MESGHWHAINEQRRELSELKAKVAVNQSQYADLKDDVNGVGRKVESSERELKAYVDAAVRSVNGRMDTGVRWLKWGVGVLAPLSAALAGIVIGRGG